MHCKALTGMRSVEIPIYSKGSLEDCISDALQGEVTHVLVDVLLPHQIMFGLLHYYSIRS